MRRNCLLKHIIEGKIEGGIEVTGRQGNGRNQRLDDLKQMRGYCKLKEEALDVTVWRTGFERGYGHVVRQNMCSSSSSCFEKGLCCTRLVR
jgi:hypothetical protein